MRCFLLAGSIIFLPVLFFIQPPTAEAIPFLIISLCIHIFYNTFLFKMYSYAEISYAYPIARGTPTLVLLFLAPFLLGDQVSFYNQLGALVLISGIFILIFSEGGYRKINFKGLGLSLIVSLTIVCYTLVDARGARLSGSAISYGIYMFALEGILINIVFSFFFKSEKLTLSFVAKEKYKIILAGFLITFSYLPILWAFTKVNVPTVAALREISILMTSIYGVYFLKERFGLVKVMSAALIVLGCVIIRLSAV